MNIEIQQVGLKEIEALRTLFLKENDFQFIYDKCHRYGWADTYIYLDNSIPIGYGANRDGKTKGVRDNIFEFYVKEPYRDKADLLFKQHCLVSNAKEIECQSNDFLLSSMLFEHALDINAGVILFEDREQTGLAFDNASLHKVSNDNSDDRQYQLKLGDEVVATGGFMLNYNFPYADLYYEVKENYRARGLGSYFTQELKKEVYLMGRVPSARCNIKNMISRATLLKAGFAVCGYILSAEIRG